jgi:putative colanic acid biosynthesis acetyltransferase WcaF
MPDPGLPTTTPQHGARWPYSPSHYAARAAWAVVRATVWPLLWKRVPALRCLLLRCFGTKTNLKCEIAGTCRVEMPWKLTLGEHTAIGPRVKLYNLGPLTIGSRTIISQDATLCGGTHDYTSPTFELIRSPITIGDDAWIAAQAFIGPGVTVGHGAVVAAGAVVVRDVEPWTVVGGNPAKFIKKREVKPTADRRPPTAD